MRETMRIKLNFLIILIIILGMGTVSAAHDIDDNLSVDSFSISETDCAVFNNHNSTNFDNANPKITNNPDDSSILGVALDYKNGSTESKKDILGSYDEENEYDGQVFYVNPDEGLYTNINSAIDASKRDSNAVILIKPGVYTGNSNMAFEIGSNRAGLLIKADGGPVILDCEKTLDFFYNIQRNRVTFSGITFKNKINPDTSAFEFNKGAKFINCTFENLEGHNYYGEWIGAPVNIINEGFYSFKDCTFVGNKGEYGGCIYVESNADIVIDNCTFKDNSADYGGAIYIYYDESTNIKDCTFKDNSAYYGGALYFCDDNTFVERCIFKSNSANGCGGAIYLDGDYGSPVVGINSNTFDSNTADWGANIYNYKGTIPNFSNNVFYNSDDENGVYNDEGSIDYSYKGPFYVSTDGSDENDGSIDSPFKTIQKAMSVATNDYYSHSIFINEGI